MNSLFSKVSKKSSFNRYLGGLCFISYFPDHSSRDLKASTAGFSLMEILLVLFLIASLSSLGVSRWHSWMQRQMLTSATQQLHTLMYTLKSHANRHNRTMALVVKPQGANEWCVQVVAEEASSESNSCQHRLSLAHIDLSDGSYQILFYGERSTAKAVTVRLYHGDYEMRLILSTMGRLRGCSVDGLISGWARCT